MTAGVLGSLLRAASMGFGCWFVGPPIVVRNTPSHLLHPCCFHPAFHAQAHVERLASQLRAWAARRRALPSELGRCARTSSARIVAMAREAFPPRKTHVQPRIIAAHFARAVVEMLVTAMVQTTSMPRARMPAPSPG